MTAVQCNGLPRWTETFTYATVHSLKNRVNWSKAKYPALSEISTRRETFFDWPKGKDQTANDLSQAGFFYSGTSDCTRCFCCGGGLRNWLPGDDPWEEHARWFPECLFLQNNKENIFIESFNINRTQSVQSSAPTPTLVSTNKISRADLVDSVLNMPCSVSLIILGFSMSLVRKAVAKVLTESDWDENKVTTTRLAEVAIEMRYETDTWESNPDDTTVTFDGAIQNGSSSAASENKPNIRKPGDTDGTFKLNDGKSNKIILDDKDGSCTSYFAENTELSFGDTESDIETLHLLKENERLRHQKTCKVCLDEEVSIVFLPCGHLVTCETCAPVLSQCVICRQKIAAIVKAYV